MLCRAIEVVVNILPVPWKKKKRLNEMLSITYFNLYAPLAPEGGIRGYFA
jgi:hypothetical protein